MNIKDFDRGMLSQQPERIEELAESIYKANKAQGHYEGENSISDNGFLMLVISELCEAMEADRGNHINRRARTDEFYKTINSSRGMAGKLAPEFTPESCFKAHYEAYIKGSIEEELADAAIRLLSLMAYRGYKWHKPVKNLLRGYIENSLPIHIYEAIYVFTDFIVNYRTEVVIVEVISGLDTLCEIMGVNLWLHIQLKLKYNTLRPYKHGKNY